jgi:hypothetical protein
MDPGGDPFLNSLNGYGCGDRSRRGGWRYSLTFSGKRKNGGPVSLGMYQVGEGGMPEIYQASTGKQYMIPGDNGKVISNKEMTAGGGGGWFSTSRTIPHHLLMRRQVHANGGLPLMSSLLT